jgi:Predicted membrane protein (DUF2306)
MAISDLEAIRRVGPAKRAIGWLIIAAIAGFVISAAGKAIIAAFMNEDFPESLAVKVELLPVIFPLHMVTGGLALLLVPLAISLRRRPPWHRLAGRIAAVDILLAGITALPVAWTAPVTFWSAAGFVAQGTTWLILLGLGLWHIRNRRFAQHQAMMVMLAATTSGAIFFRIYLALWAIFAQGRHFELFYACDAWIAWGLPLAVSARLMRQNGTWRSFSP